MAGLNKEIDSLQQRNQTEKDHKQRHEQRQCLLFTKRVNWKRYRLGHDFVLSTEFAGVLAWIAVRMFNYLWGCLEVDMPFYLSSLANFQPFAATLVPVKL